MDKSQKKIIPFVVAIILGIVSVISVNKYISAKTHTQSVSEVKILVAAKHIAKGETISLDEITSKTIPLSLVSEVNISVPSTDSSRSSNELNVKKSLVAGRVATRTIPVGDPIFWTDFRDAQSTTLSDKLPENKRAVTIPVDALTSIGHNMVPGDHIDIIATKTNCGNPASILSSASIQNMISKNSTKKTIKTQEPSSYILMQDVLVLAVGQDFNTFRSTESGRLSYSNITLQVSLKEAVMLTHARTQASLSCILRSPATVNRLKGKTFSVNCSSIQSTYIHQLDEERAKELQERTKPASIEANKNNQEKPQSPTTKEKKK